VKASQKVNIKSQRDLLSENLDLLYSQWRKLEGLIEGSDIHLTQDQEPNPLKRPNYTRKCLMSGKVLQIRDLDGIIDGL
jgi:hypothetical protein